MWRFFGLILIIWLAMGSCIVVLCHGVQASSNPFVDAVLPDTACEQPCWRGIQPGITDYKDAHNLVAALPNTTPIENDIDAWWWWIDDMPQHEIRLVFRKDVQVWIAPQGVRLGDIVQSMGEPAYQHLQVAVVGRQLSQTRIVELYYPPQQLIVTLELALGEAPTPYLPVLAVRYYPEALARPFGSTAWTGFTQGISVGGTS